MEMAARMAESGASMQRDVRISHSVLPPELMREAASGAAAAAAAAADADDGEGEGEDGAHGGREWLP